MRGNFKLIRNLGKILITAGFGLLALAWVSVVLGSKAAQLGFFSTGEVGGVVDDSSFYVVSGFALAHLISIFLIFFGLIRFFWREFSIRNKSSMLWGICGLIVLGGSALYLYRFIYGYPF